MDREDAIVALRNEAAVIRAFGATALYLYGSTARDQATPQSDVDIFIDHPHGAGFSLIELIRIKHYLEDRFGVAVDVTTRDSLHPLLRQKIEASSERIF